ncbi:MAG: prepilin-type N-terminal cleavage/methylation domain-containing protein [Candidatus Omnitrophica bacterium]|nr:prepilin-type N-terminal cleavage/methylation domain-containing protein [Candidatus Omnitrophota bacterium]
MKKGFTLIELMVVMVVIAILVGIAIPRFKGMQDEANITKAQSELKTLQVAVESYRSNQNPPAYPDTATSLVEDYLLDASPQIVSSILYDPFNPDNEAEYQYILSDDGHFYIIYSYGPDGVSNILRIQDSTGDIDVDDTETDDIFVTNGSGNFGV